MAGCTLAKCGIYSAAVDSSVPRRGTAHHGTPASRFETQGDNADETNADFSTACCNHFRGGRLGAGAAENAEAWSGAEKARIFRGSLEYRGRAEARSNGTRRQVYQY